MVSISFGHLSGETNPELWVPLCKLGGTRNRGSSWRTSNIQRGVRQGAPRPAHADRDARGGQRWQVWSPPGPERKRGDSGAAVGGTAGEAP